MLIVADTHFYKQQLHRLGGATFDTGSASTLLGFHGGYSSDGKRNSMRLERRTILEMEQWVWTRTISEFLVSGSEKQRIWEEAV